MYHLNEGYLRRNVLSFYESRTKASFKDLIAHFKRARPNVGATDLLNALAYWENVGYIERIPGRDDVYAITGKVKWREKRVLIEGPAMNVDRFLSSSSKPDGIKITEVGSELLTSQGVYRHKTGPIINMNNMTITHPEGTELLITSSHIALLFALLKEPGAIVSHARLLDTSQLKNIRSLRVRISEMRRAYLLEEDVIVNERSQGYRIAGMTRIK